MNSNNQMTARQDMYDREENYFPEADLIATMSKCVHFSDIKRYIKDPEEDTLNAFLQHVFERIANLSPAQLIIYTLSFAGEMPPKYRKRLMSDARAAMIHAQAMAEGEAAWAMGGEIEYG